MMRTDYSVVIPIFNEEETLGELWKRLHNVLGQLEGSSEVIFINDGSKDSSLEILIELNQKYPEIKIINLSRNFGHQCALSAGIDQANGNAVVLMDGDLQDSPEAILNFVEKWQEGYDVVYAMMPERNKYISGLRAFAGFKQTGIVVERGPRYKGEPRVTLLKLIKLAFDGIFSFSTIPLKISIFLGLTFASASFIIGLVGLYYKFVLRQEFLSWDHGLTTTFFLGGIQLVSLGIIGEYIGRIYDEVKQRPYYIIREKIGFEE